MKMGEKHWNIEIYLCFNFISKNKMKVIPTFWFSCCPKRTWNYRKKNAFLKINKENLREWIIKYLELVSLEVNNHLKIL